MSKPHAPRPKRGGEEFARSHYSEDVSTSKKVRFDTRNPAALAADAPEDDAVLDADVIGRRGAQAKRSAVNIDGYESDSSNEGFNARADAKEHESKKKGGNAKSQDEDDGDMFADVEEKEFGDGDEDEDLRKEGKKRKSVKLADMKDIDGQVMSSTSGGHISADILQNPDRRDAGVESESEGSSDDDDEGRAALGDDVDKEIGAGGKKKHAPRLDAFNLKEEREEGAIDEHHNYVRKAADPDAVYDNWLEGTSKKDMRKAAEAHQRRERERRAKDQEDDEVLTGEILKNLIPNLEMGETVMEALARLGRSKSNSTKKTPKWKAKKKDTGEMEVDRGDNSAHSAEDEPEKQRRQAVEAITDAADRLMRRGHEDIYDDERETLTRLYKRETGEEWVDKKAGSAARSAATDIDEDENAQEQNRWEYRWADARDGGTVHGPYDGSMMEAWNNAGYFGEGVEFRLVGDSSATWSSSVQFT